MRVRSRAASSGEDGLLHLVGRIYEAALQPEMWPDVLARTADHLHATSASLIVQDGAVAQGGDGAGGSVVPQVFVSRLDPETLGEYQRFWAPHDLGRQAMERMPAGAVATDQSMANSDEYRRSAIYNDFLVPRQIARVLAGLPLTDEKGLAHVFFHRPATRGPYESKDLERLRRLLPHLARALTLRRHLFDLASARQAAVDALDRLPAGVVFVGGGGEVAHMNRAARAIAAEADGLTVTRRCLSAALPAETRVLQQRIREAAATHDGKGIAAGGALRLTRPSLKRPLFAVVTPLRSPSALGPRGGPVAAVFVSDPERERALPHQMLREVYGLTPAEARVASHLASGRTLEEVAQRLDVRLETVRSQLKSVFQKTDTRRQAELVALLARSFVQASER